MISTSMCELMEKHMKVSSVAPNESIKTLL